MSVSDVSQKAIANLGWTDIRMPAPVFNGDTLYAESEVPETRESRSRPTQGVVTIATRAQKPDGTLVMGFKRTMLIPKRGHSIEDKSRPRSRSRCEGFALS
jgi:itaconyl-CoA hydratase